MKLVVGLGNPGGKYEATRHNAGFWVVDEVAARLGTACTKAKWKSYVAETRVGGERLLLCKPQTFMNRSGEAVRAVLDYFSELTPADVIVAYDDMDFLAGDVRLRLQGSAGGHNGVRSVIAHLGTQEFARVRVGIGRPEAKPEVIDYVLSPVPQADKEAVTKAVERAAEAVVFAVENTFTLAMNRFNGS